MRFSSRLFCLTAGITRLIRLFP